ncbi:MAG: Asp-tRNA(Asn)/Glu-tRNA(Gln) amidotransferase subunit GatC [Endomicrobium sp.]|jgi:aspartyl-tRNA(Asn)/glutamyl-tRNA(Gln) amidotransferase subunit C|nr:Asp-tRNA(Asn)/Glu-tRNA(Gln) amidotransferase subunit GatC [Endomicrobium sp.]
MLKSELNDVAFVAKIFINDVEKERYLKSINEMLDYVKILLELDINNLEPTIHVTKLRNIWREDVVKKCSNEVINQILNAAPEKEGNFYKIRKVIES